MSKTTLIIKREYLTRVKKKSFILLTLLAPFLFAGFFALIIFLVQPEQKDYQIQVIDDTNIMFEEMASLFNKKISDVKWSEAKSSYVNALADFRKDESEIDYLVWLPKNVLDMNNNQAQLIYKKAPNVKIETKILKYVNDARESYLITKHGVSREKYNKVKTTINLSTLNITNLDEDGKKKEEKADFKVAAGVGFGFSVLILMFIFTFGMQVMRGVIEEKTSRIIEVIISSVKPFQLMMGKIIGIGLVGLTQFVVWFGLTAILILAMVFFLGIEMGSPEEIAQMSKEMAESKAGNIGMQNDFFNAFWNLPWLQIIFSFFFYFLGGYLLYSSLYAAIGAAVDSETDTQQFLMPIMLPLMLGFYVTQLSVMTNPEGSAMFWLSMIPFTSPVAMLVRISMESVSLWEVLLSMFLLIITFVGTTWVAGKIYRTGILMYGKKASWKEMFKWLKY